MKDIKGIRKIDGQTDGSADSYTKGERKERLRKEWYDEQKDGWTDGVRG